MRGLPTLLTEELLKEASFLSHLLTFYTEPAVRYCDLDVDLYSSGNWFIARGWEFTEIECSLDQTVDQITLSIDNTDLFWSGMLMTQEIRGKRLDLALAAVDGNAKLVASSPLFCGLIDSADISDDPARASIVAVSPMIYWKRKTPRRKHSADCPWAFKGAECRYTGSETSCDQSYARCQALNNSDNFGGFRWLPGLADKEIWWGRNRSV